jgi:hypothetical protein
MPLPDISVTWQYHVNRSMAQATDLLHRQTMLLEIVRSLLGAGTGWTDASGVSITPVSPWETLSSSNSVSVSDSNLWLSATNLVWAAEGVAHSWWVGRHLNFFGQDLPLYMLINCSQGGAHRNATIGVYLSRSDFGEGSITDRPVADEEIEVLPSDGSMTTAPWQGPATNDATHQSARLHCMLSPDGNNFRVIICRTGVEVAVWDLFRDANYDTDGWSNPCAMTVYSRNSDAALWTWANLEGTELYHTRDDVSVEAEFTFEPSMTIVGSTPITELPVIACGGESGWDTIKLAAVTPGAGLQTAIPDARWGLSIEPDGHFGDNRTFQQFTNLVIPWNTTVCSKA